jgi:hypothetical protein
MADAEVEVDEASFDGAACGASRPRSDGDGDGAPGGRSDGRSVLARLQLGIESLYRVDTRLDVESFLIDDDERRRASLGRTPREQILLRQDARDELRIGVFVDGRAVANLEAHDPARGLDETNFADFCVAVEGVSHFIYLALCAADDRPVSALELELQAEVDKFACCVLLAAEAPGDARDGRDGDGGALAGGAYGGSDGDGEARLLRRRLFHEITFAPDLDADERDRYRVANSEARRYADTLARRYVARARVPDMLPELRRFYRFGLDAKLGHIARVAA